MLLLLPTYRQKLKSAKPCVRTVRQWDSESVQRLQDCFALTDWEVFVDAGSSIHEHADAVSSYISFCQDLCLSEKTTKSYANDKPWFNASLRQKLREKETAYSSGDRAEYKRAKYGLQRAIRGAKLEYRRKLEDKFLTGDSRTVWQGLQTITSYKQKSAALPGGADAPTPDDLNAFYARFDRQNTTPITVPPPDPAEPLPPPFTVQEHEVRKLLRQQNARKAAGPDGVFTATLRHCADQLAPVLTHLFNSSLQQHTVPSCFKSSTIIPVPKKPKVSALNDFRPVALTSVVMKVFERLVLKHLKLVATDGLDPNQFAYRANRSVEDAVAHTIHFILQNLEVPNTYARVLFVDYSSAFNTILPQLLYDKLCLLPLAPSMCHWVLDFLRERPQVVRMGDRVSDTLTLSTGAPQGCVLSPFLYSLFTSDCRSSHDSVQLVKFADDTTAPGIIRGGDESAYREEVASLVEWGDRNNLLLNASKTKEMVIDFRRGDHSVDPLVIQGETIERVSTFKFLGTVISDDLSWGANTDALVKKAHQRLFFLRRLKKFGLRREILLRFYHAVVESILTFSLSVWFGGTTQQQQRKLGRVVKAASRVVGVELPGLEAVYKKRATGRAKRIVRDPSHPAHSLFQLLPSGRRYRSIRTRTNRFRNSFYPRAITILTDTLC